MGVIAVDVGTKLWFNATSVFVRNGSLELRDQRDAVKRVSNELGEPVGPIVDHYNSEPAVLPDSLDGKLDRT